MSPSPGRPRTPGAGLISLSVDAAAGVALAAALIVLALVTTGGFDQSITVSAGNTWAEIAIALLGAGAGVAMLVSAANGRAWGGATTALFAALAAFTALSIAWSVQPDDSWQATNLTLAYLAAFAGAAALARIVPGRWRALVGAIAALAVIVSGYALLAKVFPASLAANDSQGRLQAPFGYWNATGTMAALGLAPCLWAWSRPDGGPVARALTVPGATILISVSVLSFSRSAVLAAVVAVGLWLALVPRRLHCALLLALAGAGAGVIIGWALSRPALTSDGSSLTARTTAGHTFGIVLLVVILVMSAVGASAALALKRIALPERVRRRVGTALVVLVALVPVAGVAALSLSSRGLTGEISHAWSSLTSVNSSVGNNPTRLGQLGSSRPLYWREGIRVGEHALLKGVGALGFATAWTRYTISTSVVVHAHSYLVQTFADLGLVGLALTVALLLAWCAAAARTLAPRTRWRSLIPTLADEREGLVALVLVVGAFGLQSAIDWTWFFPGLAVPALLCAGWLAGRGPLSSPRGPRDGDGSTPGQPRRGESASSILSRPAAGVAAIMLSALALLGGWVIWQPLRSSNAAASAETAAVNGQLGTAFSDARTAAADDPLALQPLFVLSSLYQSLGQPAAARAELVKAVDLQPQNAESWFALGDYDLRVAHRLRRALPLLLHSLMLSHELTAAIIDVDDIRAVLARQRQ